jgi:glutamate N-acetyltransferase / amino-acid N-acetyltransferase
LPSHMECGILIHGERDMKIIKNGTITSPKGFFAGATCAGIKDIAGKLDLGILFSEIPCTAVAVFTTNRIKAAPVILSQRRLKKATAGALVANSGCANACTGAIGMRDALKTTRLVADGVGIMPEDVLVASTGVIGVPLPMRKIEKAIESIALSREGGHELARAIMTTDTIAKEMAVVVKTGRMEFTIGGIAKGAGMIHPNMATMLSFIATDANLEPGFAKAALKRAADISFNMVSVDGDTSTNDTLLLMANGMAGGGKITAGSKAAVAFEEGLQQVCIYLAKLIALDGEGATRLIEVNIAGATSLKAARTAARTVISSSLVKTAVHGADPNWGRIVAALGRCGVRVTESKIDLSIGGVPLLESGKVLRFNKVALVRKLKSKEVGIDINLNLGKGCATAWGCDLSAKYVAINAEYTT